MIGNTISHYRILEKLGEGGMGVVYKAQDTTLDRFVAIKFLPPHLSKDEEAITRFIHEAKAASALDHVNIGTIYEVDKTTDGQTFIVMAYYEGETLRQRIDQRGVGVGEAIDIIEQIASGLARAHETEIVHRDIKPSNIIITKRGEAKIIDFGLAKLAGKTRLTKEGSTLGTAAYMSPEQARGEEVDHRSDIFSLGCIFYELLTSTTPFRGEHEAALLYEIVHQEPETVSSQRTDLPTEIDRVIEKTMAKKPNERYQHAQDLLVDLKSLREWIESNVEKSPLEQRAAGRRFRLLLYAVIVVIVAIIFFALLHFLPKGEGPIDAIAVLPLENLSGDSSQDYFADGMTEALIADLAKISALKVISRTSIMQYKEKRKPLPEIADELGVDAIVEGSVLRAGDRIRITAQLIEAATDRHLWVESYEHDVRDVLTLQSEVARAIASEIEVTLTPREREQFESAGQVEPEAHEAYLKGRYQWNKRTSEALAKSIEYFEQAIEIDPDYALAYAGLADVWWVHGDLGIVPPREAYRKSRINAKRALELDEDLAEAHTALAQVAANLDWNFKEAEEGFKRALTLNPNYATAHQLYAEFLTHMGRLDEALLEITKAQELDPFSIIISAIRITVYKYARRYDEAILAAKETLELDEHFPVAFQMLASTYYDMGLYDLAVSNQARSMSELGSSGEVVDSFMEAYSVGGAEGIARWNIKHADRMLMLPHSESFLKAESYANLGEVDSMVVYLEKMLENRSIYSLFIGVDCSYDPYRSDPRFEALIDRIGLPVSGIESN